MSVGILIHAPREGSDVDVLKLDGAGVGISIHAPREGSDRLPPAGSGTGLISIHAPREGSDLTPISLNTVDGISIHAPREGSDLDVEVDTGRARPISIHAPREGSDLFGVPAQPKLYKFLSTLPARGATRKSRAGRSACANFYPRSPRGERLYSFVIAACPDLDFYPRSP